MSPGPPRPAGFFVTRIPEQLVAVCFYAGPAVDAGKAFEYVTEWARIYHVEPWGPLVGVYRDEAAAQGAELEAEAWLPLPPDLQALEHQDHLVHVRKVGEELVAGTLYRGFPDGVGKHLEELLIWAERNGLVRVSADHRQVYRAAPPGRPGEWEVEIQVPVRKEKEEEL